MVRKMYCYEVQGSDSRGRFTKSKKIYCPEPIPNVKVGDIIVSSKDGMKKRFIIKGELICVAPPCNVDDIIDNIYISIEVK